MMARAFSWTPRAQAWRVAMVDARASGIDLAFGLFYVLAGFFLPPPNPQHTTHVVATPFVGLSFVLFYLAIRLCGPEGEDTTAMFYANLPRRRDLSYWAHAAWLGVVALALEAVIMLAMVLRLNASRADQQFLVAPFMFILPYFVITFWMWVIHGRRWILDVPIILVTLVGLIWLIFRDCELRGAPGHRFPVTVWANWGPALALALLTVYLLWLGRRRWMKLQVGELS